MAGVIVCPTCGKRFAAKPELMGKRLRCPSCREPFTVGVDTQEEFDLAPPAPPPREPDVPTPPPLSRPAPSRGARTAAASKFPAAPRAKLELTDRERAWLRFGASLVGFGLLGLILPFFGLKFKKVQNPEQQQAVAVGVAVVGAVICGLVFVRRYLKYALMIAGGGIALIVVGGTLLVMAGRPGGCMSSRPKPPDPQPPSAFDRPTFPRPGGPGPTTPPRPPSGPTTYEGLVEKFGADKVARIHIPGATRERDAATIDRIQKALRETKAATWVLSSRNNRLEWIAAPVPDIGALSTVLAFGPAATVDMAQRTITITLPPDRPGPATAPAR